jgi:hypothetical protein
MPPRAISAGIALAADGPALSTIEVLRGRTVHLWPRAFIEGLPVVVRSWRLVDGAADGLSRTSGAGGQPADASWSVPTTQAFTLWFEVTSDAFGGRSQTASVAVTVRSPALQQ